ncbi:sulfatase-like hydrolase/transferase [Pedobacter aquae]|uniref:Sulfatase-like hydrolase/transferase n=1 Tax=Pedobacter aquae TaxID=2605747 RepID=A0A5C0VHF0_9SPHI|nr:alkaline phosphatase family protein [Pedobacter aquae]QEK52098.1 sulfatase-like hydrolase/transferase [Pedobacter aquae]
MLKFLRGNIYFSLLLRLFIIVVLYAICRIAFYIFNASSFPEFNFSHFLMLLYGGLKFDISAIIYLNLLFIASQIIPLKVRYSKRYQKIFAGIFFFSNGLGLAFNIGDIAYFPFTLKRSTFSMFSQFSNEQNLGTLALKFIFIDYWYTTLLFALCLYAMYWTYKQIPIKKPKIKNTTIYGSSAAVMMLLIIWFSIAGMRGGFRHSTRPITLSNAGEYVQDPSEINIVINTPFSIIRTLKTKPLKEQNFFSKAVADSLYNPIKRPILNQKFKPKNVVVIILESFSREYIGFFNPQLDGGKYKGYTPFLDSLARHSLCFTNAYANGRKSIEGLPSVISSIPGINEPFVLSYYSGNRINSLGGLLAEKGYHTSFFHGAPNGSMGFSSYIKMAGIKHYFGKSEYAHDDDFDGIWGIWDEPFLQYWAKNINTFKQPFFTSVFTLSSHHPFKLPAAYEGKFPKGTLPIHQNVGYTDMALRKFFKTVAKSEWYKNTLFIITADHSTLASHPEYQTSLGAFAVPIIIFDPSGDLKGVRDYPVQQIDIAPTILNYLNFDKAYFAFGHDMLQPQKNHFIVNTIDGNYEIIKDQYVLKYNEESSKLYNYKNDVLLKAEIGKSHPQEKQELETYLKAFIQQYNKNMIGNSLTVD